MNYVVDVPPVHSLAVAGATARFPVNRIFCVGRNYAAHAREMGMDEREPPFFFMKPASAAVDAGKGEVTVPYPSMTTNFHHEIELVVALARGGASVSREDAEGLVYGYAAGLDMTRRDLQFALRDKGRPWEFGKAFTHSAPIGAIHPAASIGHLKSGAISLNVNGTSRQSSDISKMIWNVPECIAFLSKYEALQAGDLIMTGTPEGVNAVVSGDLMQGRIEGLSEISVRVL